jgi:hypothetical protein
VEGIEVSMKGSKYPLVNVKLDGVRRPGARAAVRSSTAVAMSCA